MLECLFYPRSIAVIGASRTPGKVGYEIASNILKNGFVGKLVPINPATDVILDLKCFDCLDAYGEKIDLSIIAVPRMAVPKAVTDSINAGAKAIVVITAGFKEAVEKANLLGYPVAMKIVSKDIIHKSDVSGVKINLMNADSVNDAFDLMTMRLSRKNPKATLEGVYIEKMCPPGREIILGTKRDPQFGPMLMFGLGGIFVEILKDLAFHLAPLTLEEALQMLKDTRTYHLLA